MHQPRVESNLFYCSWETPSNSLEGIQIPVDISYQVKSNYPVSLAPIKYNRLIGINEAKFPPAGLRPQWRPVPIEVHYF